MVTIIIIALLSRKWKLIYMIRTAPVHILKDDLI